MINLYNLLPRQNCGYTGLIFYWMGIRAGRVLNSRAHLLCLYPPNAIGTLIFTVIGHDTSLRLTHNPTTFSVSTLTPGQFLLLRGLAASTWTGHV